VLLRNAATYLRLPVETPDNVTVRLVSSMTGVLLHSIDGSFTVTLLYVHQSMCGAGFSCLCTVQLFRRLLDRIRTRSIRKAAAVGTGWAWLAGFRATAMMLPSHQCLYGDTVFTFLDCFAVPASRHAFTTI
jgi:hypothetical protein